MWRSPAVQIEFTPNGSFSRPRILTTDPELPDDIFKRDGGLLIGMLPLMWI